MRMPAAVLSTEAAAGRDIGRGQNKVHTVCVFWQSVGTNRAADYALNCAIAETRTGGITVNRRATEGDDVTYVGVGSVVVSRVDVEIWRAANVSCEIRQDCSGAVAAPIAVPDVIDVSAAENQRSTMIIDPVTALWLGLAGLARVRVFVLLFVVIVAQTMNNLLLVREFGLAALRKSDTEKENQHEHAKSRESGDKSLHLLGSS